MRVFWGVLIFLRGMAEFFEEMFDAGVAVGLESSPANKPLCSSRFFLSLRIAGAFFRIRLALRSIPVL